MHRTIEVEADREEEEAMSEGQFVTGLYRTKSSTVLQYGWGAASMQHRRQRQMLKQWEEQKQDEPEPEPQETYPPLEKLNFKRKCEKKRLKECRDNVDREVWALRNWKSLQEPILILFANDPAARKSAEHNFPIGIAQQIHQLHDLAKDLRNRIYDASEGKCDLGADYRNDVPIERRMILLVDKLERCCKKTFEAERRRLEKMKRIEEEGRKDSAVVCGIDEKSSIVAIDKMERQV